MSETRLWMAFVMGASMAIVVLSFMLGMYQDREKNLMILVGSFVVFVGAGKHPGSQDSTAGRRDHRGTAA